VKSNVRLLAVDIDGTLLDPNYQISSGNLAALQLAHENGVEIVLVTGRRHAFALPVAQALGFPVCLISSNGAVTRSSSGDLFHQDLLPRQIALKLCAHMDAFRGNMVITFDREGRGALVLERLDELSHSIQRWLEKNEPFLQFISPIETSLVTDPIQAMFCGTIERMRPAEAHLLSADFVHQITALKTQYDARDLCMIDVLTKGCSKGHALERWAAHRGIAREQVMAIGDNFNDVEMLEFAGIPVIMGNACAELKQNGWTVTLANDQDGVAAALESIFSGR
jgi:Cof subfamily protein (haloacid dehalogenase superfamily)